MKDLKNKMRVALVLALITATVLMNSCKKDEERLIPTESPEPWFKLPQGNHDFDQRILSYHDRWGTYLLYKFTEKDISWTATGNLSAYKSIPSEETFVSLQLDLVEDTFFKYYQDSTLQKYLPIKLFLCSSLIKTNTAVNAYLLPLYNGNLGGDQSFAVSGGNSNIVNINKEQYRGDVNFSFLKMMDLEGKIKESELFLSISDYKVKPKGSVAYRYQRGFLGSTDEFVYPARDWQSYIQAIVSHPYTFLSDPITTADDASAKGILSPVKDTNGLIRQKYNAIVKYYKDNHNIDLQDIGDGK